MCRYDSVKDIKGWECREYDNGKSFHKKRTLAAITNDIHTNNKHNANLHR